MTLYEVGPTVVSQSIGNEIDASHKWGLPGVKCPLCGATWGSVGVAYPSVDLSCIASQKRYHKSWPVPLDELEELRLSISYLLPNNLPLPPGTQLGPLIGNAKGPFEDFVWNGYWDILVKASVLTHMRAIGVRLSVGVHPLLKFRGNQKEDLLELQIEPLAKMIPPPNSASICPACGRWAIERPSEIIIDGSSLPTDVDLFRVVNFATIILATEQFAEAVRNLKLTGITFKQVKVV